MVLTAPHKVSFSKFLTARFWQLIPTFILCAVVVTLVENMFPIFAPTGFMVGVIFF
jgi:hypothetical protein